MAKRTNVLAVYNEQELIVGLRRDIEQILSLVGMMTHNWMIQYLGDRFDPIMYNFCIKQLIDEDKVEIVSRTVHFNGRIIGVEFVKWCAEVDRG